MSATQLRWINLIGWLAMILVNGLALYIPLNGMTTGEISALYPVMITPAPYTFGIWGLIYFLLLLFVLYQSMQKHHRIVSSIGSLFIISCTFNISWILLWHYMHSHVYLSLIAMSGLLVSLIFMHMNITKLPSPTPAERWLVRMPIIIYLGWISVATIVNTAVVLYQLQWDRFGLNEETWTVIMLSLGTILAWLVGIPYRRPAFMFVYVWAYIGIAFANEQHPTVMYSALGLAALIGLLALTVPFRPRQNKQKQSG